MLYQKIGAFIGSLLIALFLGALCTFIISLGYRLPGFFDTSGIFMFILESPIGKWALRNYGGEGGLLIATAMRAFGFSVLTGIITGFLLPKLRFPRVVCYAVLGIFVANIARFYWEIQTGTFTLEQISFLQTEFNRLVWQDFCIFAWFATSTALSCAAFRYLKRRKNRVENSAAVL